MTLIRHSLFAAILIASSVGAEAAEWRLTKFGGATVESRSFSFSLNECLGSLRSSTNQQVWSCEVTGPLGLNRYHVIHQPVADYVSLEDGCQVKAIATPYGPKMEVRRTEAKKFQSMSRDTATKCLSATYVNRNLSGTDLSVTYLTWGADQANVTQGTYEVETAGGDGPAAPQLQVPLPGGAKIKLPIPNPFEPKD